jgi:hypothetical protein
VRESRLFNCISEQTEKPRSPSPITREDNALETGVALMSWGWTPGSGYKDAFGVAVAASLSYASGN